MYKVHHQEIDYIQTQLEPEEMLKTERICSGCGCKAGPNFGVCRNCGGNIFKHGLSKAAVPSIDTNPYKSFDFDSASDKKY